ncbi:MAG: Jag N-terminal domain-containing protein [Clostridia bacterium]|nr:Jag N-terminal domain-containing protein [Clostridia bacterium]
MKKEYIIAAKTVEEAISDARIRYGSEGELSFEVLEMPKKGFLGIGASPAKIRVTVEEEEEDLMSIFGSSKMDARPAGTKREENPHHKKENKPAQSNVNREKKQENADRASKINEKPKEKAPKAERPIPEKKEEKPVQAPAEEAPKAAEPEEEIRVTVAEMEVALAFVKNLLSDMEIDAEAKADLTPDENGTVSRVLNIEGPGSGKLIGHHGETLDSIQYLANLALNRKHGSRRHEYVKVVVDIEGYRAKREDTLRQFARRMADKALKYKRNVLLEPMNPYERRIIHSEIQSIEGVSTHSVGADENRKIVITYDAKNGSGTNGNGRKNNRRRHHRREDKPEASTAPVPFSTETEEEEGLTFED